MTGDALNIERIDLIRAPGFEDGGFSVDELSPGINLITGPNGSGKSTLAAASQWILWPADAPDRARVSGNVALDGADWLVDIDAGHTSYQRDGSDANPPAFPPVDQRDRYELSLHDLLQHETRNESFARAIKRESAGGYDLEAAASNGLDVRESPRTRGLSEVGEVENALETLQAAKSQVSDLRGDEARLSSLESELADARDAQLDVSLYETALDYRHIATERECVEDDLATYPAILAEVDGDELDEVADLNEQIADSIETREQAREAWADARTTTYQSDLPPEGLSDGVLEELAQRRDTLDGLEDDLSECRANLAEAAEHRTHARNTVPIEVAESRLEDLDQSIWREITEFAKDAASLYADKQLEQSIVDWLDEPELPDADVPTLQEGSQALEQWLANPPTQGADGRSTYVLSVVSAVLLTIMAVALGVLANPLFLATLVFPAGILWYGYHRRTASTDEHAARETYRETFRQLQIDAPDEWEPDAVRRRLRELYRQIQAHELGRQQAERREALDSQIEDVDAREEAVAERRDELADRLGAGPDVTKYELVALTKTLLTWQEADATVHSLQEKQSDLESQLEIVTGEVDERFAEFGVEPVEDAGDARKKLRELRDAKQEFETAARELRRERSTYRDARDTVESLRSERDTIYEELDLEPGDESELRDLCDQVDEYQELRSRLADLESRVDQRETDLENEPGYEPEIKEWEVAKLERKKREAKELADQHDEILTEINEIRKEIRDAKSEHNVEDALAERDRALDSLHESYTADAAGLVANALFEHVTAETRDASRPEVFDRARDILARITSGRYRLDMQDGDDTFRAFDSVKERGFRLDQLSSATKLQVLLAVRIAFVDLQEDGRKLPLVLDETLANTDESRADAIIDSILEFARAGRQIFYFTAQGTEVAKWNAALSEAEDLDHRTVDLADIQDLDGTVAVPDYDDMSTRDDSLPDPADHDHESFGEAIDVPPFDPIRGTGHAPLWYLTDDVELLSDLLGYGIDRWGELETIMGYSDLDAISGNDDAVDRLLVNGRAMKAFVEAWQHGRGESVDRQVLEDSGAVSSNFIDDVSSLADRVNGDAQEIIAGLRDGAVTGFWNDKTDQLEAYFEDYGYIDRVEQLEPGVIAMRVAEAYVEEGLETDDAKQRAESLVRRLRSREGEVRV